MLALFAIWVLLSGLDDLFLDVAFLYRWFALALARRQDIGSACAPTEAELLRAPRKRIAIFVPLWREHNVIRKMIEHNLRANRYGHCDFFVGVYPNDEPTLAAVRVLVSRFPGVHLSLCPHAGPTSKPDNLNWIFESMLRFESDRQAGFDVVVTHDPGVLMLPEALGWANYPTLKTDMG